MWQPTLPDSGAPIYQRLTDALRADVAAGRLRPGERLPPQRDLAFRLGLGVGTVTRAYAEAERRGLLVGEVGRGSFVAGGDIGAVPQAGPIDMARNLPPLGPSQRALAAAIARLARRRDLESVLAYAPGGGAFPARRALAAWLARTANFGGVDPERIVVTAGAQQGMAVALGALCRPGDAVIAEAATFHGLKGLAAQAGWRLIPAAMDGEGLRPDALERAAQESGARAAYVLPVQNPTAAVMGEARRRELTATARRLGVTLVEDDLYAPYAAELGHAPLAAFAPDVVWHVTSLSKSLAPGLRVGCVIAPDARGQAAAIEALRALAFGAPTFGPLIAAEWIEGGEADAILAAVKAEVAARTALAREMLGGALAPTPMAAAPHLWLPMGELAAERLAGRALRGGVETTPPGTQSLAGGEVSGLRICLGGARDLAETRRGLGVLKAALAPGAPEPGLVV